MLLVAATLAAAEPTEGLGQRPTDERFHDLAAAKVTSFLADPEGARIKWDRAIVAQSLKPGLSSRVAGWWTCGLLNAKNQFGGYVGYRRFMAVVRDDRVVYTNTSDGPDDFADRTCKAAISKGELPELATVVAPGPAAEPK